MASTRSATCQISDHFLGVAYTMDRAKKCNAPAGRLHAESSRVSCRGTLTVLALQPAYVAQINEEREGHLFLKTV